MHNRKIDIHLIPLHHRFYREKHGFTILEILVVIFLITIILSMSSVFITSLPSNRFRSTARDIAATIRHAKYLLQTSGEKQVVKIDIDTKRYGIEGRSEKEIPQGIDLKITDAFEGDISEGVFTLSFSRSGVSGGGTIILWDEKREAMIKIDPVIGAAVIQ